MDDVAIGGDGSEIVPKVALQVLDGDKLVSNLISKFDKVLMEGISLKKLLMMLNGMMAVYWNIKVVMAPLVDL